MRRGRAHTSTLAALLWATLWATDVAAQAPSAVQPLDRPLRVFVDCRAGGCDQEFFRTELAWVDHVRDQKDADVHVLVTGQGTGGGGTEYTIRFIGHGPWDGQEDTLRRNTEAAETEDGRRRALTQVFALGLARFAAATPIGTQLRVTPPVAATQSAQTTAADDPWNYWVFRTNFNLNLNGEATSKFANMNANQSANRTTAAWKLNFNAGVNYNEGEYDLGEGEIFRSFRRGWNVNGLVVKSMGEHWSLGGKAGVQRSSFNNQKLNVRVAPGIEYNLFPYSKSTERQLTVQWTTGINRFVYDELTIFGKTEETKWDQASAFWRWQGILLKDHLSFLAFVIFPFFVVALGRGAFISSARAMILWNILPVSPPLAGGFRVQTSGVPPARMSSKSASGVCTLSGANSVMSIGPAQSSRCLIRSQLFGAPLKPRVFTSTHDPLSL